MLSRANKNEKNENYSRTTKWRKIIEWLDLFKISIFNSIEHTLLNSLEAYENASHLCWLSIMKPNLYIYQYDPPLNYKLLKIAIDHIDADPILTLIEFRPAILSIFRTWSMAQIWLERKLPCLQLMGIMICYLIAYKAGLVFSNQNERRHNFLIYNQ